VEAVLDVPHLISIDHLQGLCGLDVSDLGHQRSIIAGEIYIGLLEHQAETDVKFMWGGSVGDTTPEEIAHRGLTERQSERLKSSAIGFEMPLLIFDHLNQASSKRSRRLREF